MNILQKEKERTGVHKNILWLMILSSTIMVTVSATIMPVIFQEITPYLKNAYVYLNVVGIGMGMLTTTVTANKKLIMFLDKHFNKIVAIDLIVFIVVSIIGLYSPLCRIFGMEFINTTTTMLWVNIFRKAINNYVSGDELTCYQNTKDKYLYIGAFIGAIIAIPVALVPNIYVLASFILIAVTLMAGVTDIIIRKKILIKIEEEDENEKRV